MELAKYLQLQDINDKEAKAIFQFRSRMANFHENYKNNAPLNHCPLCSSHPDTQKWAFKCSVLKKSVQINGTYENIIEGKIDKPLAKTAFSILKYREMAQ